MIREANDGTDTLWDVCVAIDAEFYDPLRASVHRRAGHRARAEDHEDPTNSISNESCRRLTAVYPGNVGEWSSEHANILTHLYRGLCQNDKYDCLKS